jgi:hypothetical protein
MNSFEDSLLSELRTVVAKREPRRSLASRLGKPGFVALPAGALGIAAAAAVGVSALGGASAAYAVTTASSGDVVVTINSLSDASGLQSALRADGVDAYVNYDTNTGVTTSTGPDGAETVVNGGTPTPGATGTAGQHPVLAQGVGGVANPNAPQSNTTSTPIPGADGLEPVNVQITQNSTTLDIPAADVNSGYTLHITTSGSESGVAGLQLAWWN